jgi:hypothetical protein
MVDPNQLPQEEPPRFSRAQKQLVGFVLVLAVVNVAYRLVYATGLARTSALYVGIPTLLAIGLALLPRSRSATAMLLKGGTLAVLLAGVVLPEGLICLLFVVPLVALVAVIVGGLVDLARRHRRKQGPTLMVVSLPLLVMSLEGVVGTPFDTHEAVSATAVVDADAAEVVAALAATPTFDADIPPFLSMGFNRPVSATGAGLVPGDARMIEFTGGSHDDHPLRLFDLTGERSVDHHSHMRLTVVESTPGRAVFRVDEDTTMLSRWAVLQRAVVTWAPVGGSTRVTWRLEFERLIHPAAYFGPLMRFGMGQVADYLLDAVVEHRLS